MKNPSNISRYISNIARIFLTILTRLSENISDLCNKQIINLTQGGLLVVALLMMCDNVHAQCSFTVTQGVNTFTINNGPPGDGGTILFQGTIISPLAPSCGEPGLPNTCYANIFSWLHTFNVAQVLSGTGTLTVSFYDITGTIIYNTCNFTFGCVTPPTPPVLSVTNNTCSPAVSGSFNVTTPCRASAHIEYSTDAGTTWTTTVPAYANSVSVVSRCVDNADATCKSINSNSVVASAATAPTANAGADVVLNCTTTTATLGTSAIIGNTYSWSPSVGLSSATIAQPIANAAGSYTLIVTNTVNGCTATDAVLVSSNITAPTANAGADVVLNCTTTTAPLGTTAVSGNTYSWSPSVGLSAATIAQPVANAAGTYTLTVVNTANGCSATDAVMVSSNITVPTANAGGDVVLTCSVTSATIGTTSVSGNTYSWSPSVGLSAATIAQPVANAAGTYTLTVVNTVNGCTATDAVLVSPCIELSIVITDPCICMNNETIGDNTGNSGQFEVNLDIFGGSGPYAVVFTSNAYVFNPSNTINNAANLSSLSAEADGSTNVHVKFYEGTTYNVTVTDALGATYTLTGLGGCTYPSVNAGADATTCSGGSVTLNAIATDYNTLAWSNGAATTLTTVTAAATTNYTIVATNALGCDVQDAVTVVVNCTYTNVSGTVFGTEDANGNGVLDADEDIDGNGVLDVNFPLAGVTVTLTAPDGTQTQTTTNAAGNYIFTQVPADAVLDYSVSATGVIYSPLSAGGNIISIFNLSVAGSTGNNYLLTYTQLLALHIVSFDLEGDCNTTQLIWNVVNEDNVNYYQVQVCSDAINWVDLEIVTATNNPAAHAYTASPISAEGLNYYRIIEVSNTGASYTSIIKSYNKQCASNYIINVFPSPTTGVLYYDINAATSENATLILTDLLGRVLITKDIELQIGHNNYTIDLSHLAPSVYFTGLQSQSQTNYIKIEKID